MALWRLSTWNGSFTSSSSRSLCGAQGVNTLNQSTNSYVSGYHGDNIEHVPINPGLREGSYIPSQSNHPQPLCHPTHSIEHYRVTICSGRHSPDTQLCPRPSSGVGVAIVASCTASLSFLQCSTLTIPRFCRHNHLCCELSHETYKLHTIRSVLPRCLAVMDTSLSPEGTCCSMTRRYIPNPIDSTHSPN